MRTIRLLGVIPHAEPNDALWDTLGGFKTEGKPYYFEEHKTGVFINGYEIPFSKWDAWINGGVVVIINEEGQDMTNTQSAKIYPALLVAMNEIGAIGKNKKNPQQGYSFRGIDDVLNNLQPALIKAKVFIVPRIVDMRREERQTKAGGVLIYTTVHGEYDFVSAEDGSKVTASTFGEGMDSSDKSTNKAMSAALKYAVIQTLAIPVEGLVDSEKDNHEPAPEKGQPANKTKITTPFKGCTKEQVGAIQELYKQSFTQTDDAHLKQIVKHFTKGIKLSYDEANDLLGHWQARLDEYEAAQVANSDVAA
jgi:hypothetical protein